MGFDCDHDRSSQTLLIHHQSSYPDAQLDGTGNKAVNHCSYMTTAFQNLHSMLRSLFCIQRSAFRIRRTGLTRSFIERQAMHEKRTWRTTSYQLRSLAKYFRLSNWPPTHHYGVLSTCQHHHLPPRSTVPISMTPTSRSGSF